jgi:putative endonuclease
MSYYVYILLCGNGTYYTGLAKDLEYRIWEHEQGIHVDAYAFSRRPIRLVWGQELAGYREAFELERRVKRWNHAKKEALIRGDFEAIHAIVKSERQRREKAKRRSSPRFRCAPLGAIRMQDDAAQGAYRVERSLQGAVETQHTYKPRRLRDRRARS